MHLLFHVAKVPSGVTFPLGVVRLNGPKRYDDSVFEQASKQIDTHISKKSPTVGPTKKRTPFKPEYLLALATYLGVRW